MAGQLLIENKYYAASIHCFYYSSFQLISHIKLKNITLLNSDVKVMNSKNSHENAISIIFEDRAKSLASNDMVGMNDLRKFHQNINHLKKLRVKSDYKEIIIEKDISLNAKSIASLINLFLKKNYNL